MIHLPQLMTWYDSLWPFDYLSQLMIWYDSSITIDAMICFIYHNWWHFHREPYSFMEGVCVRGEYLVSTVVQVTPSSFLCVRQRLHCVHLWPGGEWPRTNQDRSHHHRWVSRLVTDSQIEWVCPLHCNDSKSSVNFKSVDKCRMNILPSRQIYWMPATGYFWVIDHYRNKNEHRNKAASLNIK